MEPEIRFFRTPDSLRIAYGTTGNGPFLIFVPALFSHVTVGMEHPAVKSFFGQLSQNRTVVFYDKHGCGLSERERTDFSLESEVRLLEAFVAHLKVKRFAILV